MKSDMPAITITSGGKGLSPISGLRFLLLTLLRICRTSHYLLSEVFHDQPSIVYFLSHMTPAEQDIFRPKFFDVILSAAVRNKATIHEANNWTSCGVLVPPKEDPGKLSSLLNVPMAKKLIPTLIDLWWIGCKVIFF